MGRATFKGRYSNSGGTNQTTKIYKEHVSSFDGTLCVIVTLYDVRRLISTAEVWVFLTYGSIGLMEHWATGTLGCQNIRSLNIGCRVIGLVEHRFDGTPSSHNTGQ